MFEIHSRNEGSDGESQDQFAYWEEDERLVVVFADGAGGLGNGLQAAQSVVQALTVERRSITCPSDCAKILNQADLQIQLGESTGVLLVVEQDNIYGASVGDSAAKIIMRDSIRDVTIDQNPKPRLGSREARIVEFKECFNEGLLIISSDGLWNYVNEERLIMACIELDFLIAGKEITDLVRLNSGALQDDLGIVVIRRRQIRSLRQHYVIDEI